MRLYWIYMSTKFTNFDVNQHNTFRMLLRKQTTHQFAALVCSCSPDLGQRELESGALDALCAALPMLLPFTLLLLLLPPPHRIHPAAAAPMRRAAGPPQQRGGLPLLLARAFRGAWAAVQHLRGCWRCASTRRRPRLAYEPRS